MGNLADNIEDYIKRLLTLSYYGYIDIKRKELAAKFKCVPSQVNYVLETRFTIEKGYLVESKRGGKGYLRIKKLNVSVENLPTMILKEIEDNVVSKEKVFGYLEMLFEEKYISLREFKLMGSVLESIELIEEDSLKNKFRTHMFKNMLLTLF